MKRQEPLISVVVPVYNAEQYLEGCLDSIRRQTWENLDIILVDDCSLDGSGGICDAAASADGRVDVVHFPANRGPSAARNEGIRRAKGEFLSFVDADDYIDSDMIRRLYDNLMENHADISVCGADGIRLRGGSAGVFDREQAMRALSQSRPFNLVPWGKMYAAEPVRLCPFDEDIFYSEDLLFLYRLFGRIQKVSYFPTPMYHYVDREGSQVHGRVSERKMTALAVNDFICRDAAENFPETLLFFRHLALDVNLRLAISAVKTGTSGGRPLRYLKKLRENTRLHFEPKALGLFGERKDRAAVLALYVSALAFWGITEFWYRCLKPFGGS